MRGVQQMLGGAACPGAAGGGDAVANEPAAGDEEPKHLDQTLTSDIPGTRALNRLEEYIQRERWHDVIGTLQSLIDGENLRGDTFTRKSAGRWESLERGATERVASLPAAGRELYATVYAQLATDLLGQARQAGDLHRIADVARRFANTNAGQEAIRELAILHFDRGQYIAADRWYKRLIPEATARLPLSARMRSIAAARLAGDAEHAEQLYNRLLTSEDAATPSQREQIETWWHALDSSGVGQTLPQGDWPTWLGSASHAAIAAPASSFAARTVVDSDHRHRRR
ncbi:MAG: hypothetical protein R3B90_17130 [Planctomycetaceae bacterium]